MVYPGWERGTHLWYTRDGRVIHPRYTRGLFPLCALLGYSLCLLPWWLFLLPAPHGGYSLPLCTSVVILSCCAHRCVIPPACSHGGGYSSCLLPWWVIPVPRVIPRCGLFLSRRLFPGVANLLIMTGKPATERGCAQG